MRFNVFIDGQHGTTGLQIEERLRTRDDITLIQIADAERKNPEIRATYLNQADVVFLCLPDAAARESVALITPQNTHTRILDASTAHRTQTDWTYGLPELQASQREQIRTAQRVAVPGCHATGFILLTAPLVQRGLLPRNYPANVFSISGYSGGGKDMIARYDAPDPQHRLASPRLYALTLTHKHLPEMQKFSGLNTPPLFTPMVGDFAQGLNVCIPLRAEINNDLPSAKVLHSALCQHYADQPFVTVMPLGQAPNDDLFLSATACNGTNRAELFVFGNNRDSLLCARFDNLGKGASGAAIQCMNLMLGLDETISLTA